MNNIPLFMLFYLTILKKYIDCLETPYSKRIIFPERRRTKDSVTTRLVTLPRRINQQMERIGPLRANERRWWNKIDR